MEPVGEHEAAEVPSSLLPKDSAGGLTVSGMGKRHPGSRKRPRLLLGSEPAAHTAVL